MTIENVIDIASDTIELIDRRVVAEGWGGLTVETKDYLGDILCQELQTYVKEPETLQNILPFPGSKSAI